MFSSKCTFVFLHFRNSLMFHQKGKFIICCSSFDELLSYSFNSCIIIFPQGIKDYNILTRIDLSSTSRIKLDGHFFILRNHAVALFYEQENKSSISYIIMINKIDKIYEVIQWVGEKIFIGKKSENYSVGHSQQKITVNN